MPSFGAGIYIISVRFNLGFSKFGGPESCQFIIHVRIHVRFDGKFIVLN
jgi:hypothetical protein